MVLGFRNGCTLLHLYAAEGVNAGGGFATLNDTSFMTQAGSRRSLLVFPVYTEVW